MAEKYLKRSQGKQEASRTVSPFELANIRFFLAFRVLFNARFYYPVFTILFLDFGGGSYRSASGYNWQEAASGSLNFVNGSRNVMLGICTFRQPVPSFFRLSSQ